MKTKIFVVLAATMMLALGCVRTQDKRTKFGMPIVKDSIVSRYERDVQQVYQAAKAVIEADGALANETIMHGQGNALQVVEGKVNQRGVWVKVESLDAKTTQVTVQTRTPGGGTDIDLAAQIDKEIALKLASH
ncbi:MAG TPA: DUF3568 family protein [Candidatus Dormibacteraeota bacterium]|nr:DUF3568 family protein [Candidatus Dormibacteraeota bacterium]